MRHLREVLHATGGRLGGLLLAMVVAGTAYASSQRESPPADSAAASSPSSSASGTAVIESPPDSMLVGLLRRGGLVLLFRHAATDGGQRDADAVDFADRITQRNLSAVGRAQADSVGTAVRALGLKIGPVRSSPMWRCRDTAEIAFGRADTTMHLFTISKASRDVRVNWLSMPLAGDSLLVLVSHQDPYIPLFRFQRDQLREGDALLILPLGNFQWRILAQIAPADWARLAERYGTK